MPDFVFRAADPQGRTQQGQITAADRQAALMQLHARGLTPIEIAAGIPDGLITGSPHAGAAEGHIARGRTNAGTLARKDVLSFTAELSTLLESGLPLDRALRVMGEMAADARIAELVAQVLASVKAGKGLADALSSRPENFDAFYLGIVRAGEASGRLAQALEQLARHLEREAQLRESLRSALTYPLILLLVSALSVLLMLGFVVPQFETLFDDLGDGLPWATRVLLDTSHLLTEHGPRLLLATLMVGVVLLHRLRTPDGLRWRDRQLLALPQLGKLLLAGELSRFSHTLGTLLGNGVPMVGAIRISAETVGNHIVRESVDAAGDAIKRGERLADALAAQSLFSPLAINMVRLGEETGHLDRMLTRLAAVLDKQIETARKRLLTLIEPVLILGMGALIATIMAALLLGILSVNELAI